MDIEAIVSRAAEVDAELAELAALDSLDEEQEARFDELAAEVDALAEARAKAEKRAAAVERAHKLAEKPQNVVEGDTRTRGIVDKTKSAYDVLDNGFASRADIKAAARAAVESEDFDVRDHGESVTRLLERSDDREGTLARRVLATGTRTYRDAWTKVVTGQEYALTDDERRALTRAASLTDAEGGFAVPFPIDPTLIITGDGSTNPFRMISRVVTGTSDSWQGVSAGQISASWDGEAAEVSDDAATYAQPQAVAKKAQAFVPFSIEIGQDYPGFAADTAELLRDAKDNLEAAAFATGATGGNNPAGIVPLVTAYDSGSSVHDSATTDTFALADVYTIQQNVPPRARSNSSWVANLNIINDIRQFATANNYHGFLTDLAGGQPSQLLGRPLYESSAMDGSITALSDNYVLLAGDFSKFLIYDRVGMNIELVPHLFATGNNRPSGQRGWYASWRVGTALLDGNAFSLLNVT